ncbi:MAG: hypothetical protein JWM44_1798 [Bacilli bacterium]|jgi:uncharacterized protein (TIGR00255 family)|nr:hypothetical protein [Bacilli bacterium]
MTGFGQAIQTNEGYRLQVELKSVNHRFLEMNIRLPREWIRLEDVLKQKIRSVVHRGKVDVFVNIYRETLVDQKVILDWSLAEAYFNAAQQLRAKFGLPDTFSIQDLLHIPDLITLSDQPDEANPAIQDSLLACTENALRELLFMRDAEGKHLHADLMLRLQVLKSLHQSMQVLAPKVVEQYKIKLQTRIQEMLEGKPLDEYRILQEAAIYADRSNIDEELTRLDSHFQQFTRLLVHEDPSGRKLDFLLQEMNREVNTIGSKANHTDLLNDVVEMKAELEKMREQVQNIQ